MKIKRPLVYAAGGFVLGEVLTLLSVVLGLGTALFAAAAVFWAYIRKEKSRGIILLFSVCLVCGVWRMKMENRPAPGLLKAAAESGEPVLVTGKIADIRSKDNEAGHWGGPEAARESETGVWGKQVDDRGLQYTVTLDDCDVTISGESEAGEYNRRNARRWGRMLVYIHEEDFGEVRPEELTPGQIVSVTGTVSEEKGPRNPGEFDYALYYRARGIRARAFGEEIRILDRRGSPLLTFLYRLRLHSGRILELIAEPEDAGVFQAAILGDKAGLDERLRDLYQKNGIAHLLAISGLHVSIIGAGVYGLLRRIGLGFGSAGVAAGMILVGYGEMTGSSASVNRAVLMLLCVFLAAYLGRTWDLVSAACLAGIVLLAGSPYLVTQGGFQLSFGAVLSIGVLGDSLIRTVEPESMWQRTVITSLSIQLVTYPIVLYHFYQYPVFGIFLNFLVIPLMTFVIYSGMAGILFGSFSVAAGMTAVGAGHYILAVYRLMCVWCSGLPGYTLIAGRPKLWQIMLYYSVLGAGLLSFIYRRNRGKKTSRLQLLFLSALCFCLLFHVPVKGLEVTFLDVGQGDGCFLETQDCRILVDGGSTSEKNLGKLSLEPFLKSRGVSRIDYAIVSHGDADHISGLVYLMESVPDISISCLILPCLSGEDEAYRRLKELAEQRGIGVILMEAGDRLEKGGLTLTCLYPGSEDPAADRNEQSLVLKADYDEFHMLLTGDMSSTGEARMLERLSTDAICGLSEVQVLKAAHHGSSTSSGREFLEAVNPRWTVLSYGEGNRYGHPAYEVVERLRNQDSRIWETARSGAVMLRTDGTRIWWKTMAQKHLDAAAINQV